jgi:hypothetical protein
MNRYEISFYEVRTHLVTYEVLATNQEKAIKKASKCHKNAKPIEDQMIDVEAGKMFKCYLTETKVKMPSKKKVSYGYDSEEPSYEYSHVACPSYPNCDIDPNGCRLDMGNDVEEYGMRD